MQYKFKPRFSDNNKTFDLRTTQDIRKAPEVYLNEVLLEGALSLEDIGIMNIEEDYINALFVYKSDQLDFPILENDFYLKDSDISNIDTGYIDELFNDEEPQESEISSETEHEAEE